VASRRANSRVARSATTPHERPDIRLQPIHSARGRNACTLTINGEESIYDSLDSTIAVAYSNIRLDAHFASTRFIAVVSESA
jgi:hypothetical protein